MNRVLVTGGTGFLGHHLVSTLIERGCDVVAASRTPPASSRRKLSWTKLDLDGSENPVQAPLHGIECLYHLAAHVHQKHSNEQDSKQFDQVNARATEKLALQAASAGIKRFVFVSSIKVNGERTLIRPFSACDVPSPQDPYSCSKWQAEQALADVSRRTGLEVVVVRPPLIYGPGVGANFYRLLSLVQSGWPLPLKVRANRRSLINVWNTVDFLWKVGTSKQAAGRTWLVSDDHDVSTEDLIRLVANSMGRGANFWPAPVLLLRTAARLLGRTEELSRLVDSLQIDMAETKNTLGWAPPVGLEEGIARTTEWFLETKRARS